MDGEILAIFIYLIVMIVIGIVSTIIMRYRNVVHHEGNTVAHAVIFAIFWPFSLLFLFGVWAAGRKI